MLQLDGCTIDLRAGRVVRADRTERPLTSTDVALLEQLAQAEGQPVSAEALQHCLPRASSNLAAAMHRLRGRVEVSPANPRVVLTHHGGGYRLSQGESTPVAGPRRTRRLEGGRIDLGLGEVELHGERNRLTTLEREVLTALIEADGATVSRQQLLQRAWGHAGRGQERRPDAVVASLRRKIEPLPDHPERILTVHGQGYRWVRPRASTNLAPELDTFVGRQGELRSVIEACQANRMVVLWGPAGVGKSRTAREATRRLATKLPGGAWWVDAPGTASQEVLLGTIASTLGLTERGPRPPRVLAAAVGDAPLLLVLDDFGSSAGLIRELLAAAPALRCLVTSRERMPGSTHVVLGPMTPPEARQLYFDRARALEPSMESSESDVVLLDRGLARVDRLPLAIELIAGRVDVMRPADLPDMLDPLDPAPASASSMRAALDRSWTALSPELRRGLALASLFVGPFEARALDAVERGCADRLVHHALLRQVEVSGRRFLRCYEVVRELVAERYPAGDADRAVYTRWIVERAESLLALARGRPGDAIEEVVARGADWIRASHWADAPDLMQLHRVAKWVGAQAMREVVDLAVQRFPEHPDTHLMVAMVERIKGRLDHATAAVERAVQAGRPATYWRVCYLRGWLALDAGDTEGFHTGLGPEPSAGTWWLECRTSFAVDHEPLEVAESFLARLSVKRGRDPYANDDFVASQRAVLAYNQGNLSEADHWAKRAVAMNTRHGSTIDRPYVLLQLAQYRLVAGRTASARALIAEARQVAATNADAPVGLEVLLMEGVEGLLTGALDQAQRVLGEAVVLSEQLDLSDHLSGARLGLALVRWQQGDTERALRLARAATDMPGRREMVLALLEGREPPEAPIGTTASDFATRWARDGVMRPLDADGPVVNVLQAILLAARRRRAADG